VTTLDSSRQEGSHRWPRFLPGGRQFLFTVRSGLAEHRGVFVGSLDDQTPRLVFRGDTNAQYANDHLLFLDGDTLLGRPFDSERVSVGGEPFTIAASIGRSSNGNGAFSVSPAGTIAYAAPMMQRGRLTWYSRTGNALGTVGPDGEYDVSDFRLSPDEARLAISIVDAKLATPDIWLTDLVRRGTARFTFGPALNASPVWSPDGTRIAFRTNRKGLVEFYQKSAGGGGTDEALLLEEAERNVGLTSTQIYPTDWSPDGKELVFSAYSPADLWILSLSEPRTPSRVLDAPGDQLHANFSPDGRFVAYSSNESGRFEVYVQTFPLSDRKWLISTSGGYEPRWRRDGREIYFLSEDGNLAAVATTLSATPAFGVPQVLFRTRVQPGVHALRTHYVPTGDGSRFLIQTSSGDPTPTSITVVLNWAPTR
jgi:Tol biopolymer transport system component